MKLLAVVTPLSIYHKPWLFQYFFNPLNSNLSLLLGFHSWKVQPSATSTHIFRIIYRLVDSDSLPLTHWIYFISFCCVILHSYPKSHWTWVSELREENFLQQFMSCRLLHGDKFQYSHHNICYKVPLYSPSTISLCFWHRSHPFLSDGVRYKTQITLWGCISSIRVI